MRGNWLPLRVLVPMFKLLRFAVSTSNASISKCQYCWGEEGVGGGDMYPCDIRQENASKSTIDYYLKYNIVFTRPYSIYIVQRRRRKKGTADLTK